MLLLLVTSGAIGQVVGTVDKKTKEFFIPADQKIGYTVFGYQFANNTTKRMICFSSDVNIMQDSYSKCPLGSYFDTNKMKVGDRIFYLGGVGAFAKMNFVSGDGKKTLFYLPKGCFKIK